MNRPRDRASARGLLPRMESRPRKDGLVTYRYHPVGGKPINLGTDRDEDRPRHLVLPDDGREGKRKCHALLRPGEPVRAL